ncbi:MAG: PP2C family protein-serine/threonine phosphatase [Acidobacteriota bacterium]
MRGLARHTVWLVLGLVGLTLLILAYPRAFPLMPTVQVHRGEAIDLARDAFVRLDPLPSVERWLVTLDLDPAFERHLLRDLSRRQLDTLADDRLGRRVVTWNVRLVDDEGRWTHAARIGLDGELYTVRVRRVGEPGPNLGPAEARSRAREALRDLGLDVGAYDAPEAAVSDTPGGTDVVFRLYEEPVRLDGVSSGLRVYFSGNRMTGWSSWLSDLDGEVGQREVATWHGVQIARITLVVLLFVIMAFLYYRTYDAGELRLRRALRFTQWIVGAGILWSLLVGRSSLAHFGLPGQGLQVLGGLALLAALACLAFLTAGVGEAVARNRWHHRLAAFEALLQGDFRNATVARAALHGLTTGVFAAGVAVALLEPLRWFGATPLAGPVLDRALEGGEPGVGMVLHHLFLLFLPQLLGFLVAVPLLVDRLGPRLGSLVGLLVVAVLTPAPLQPVPFGPSLIWWLLLSALPLALFLGDDLLSALLSSLVLRTLVHLPPLLAADDPRLLIGGWLTLALVVAPPLVALRWLGSTRSFTYGFDATLEVPADVLVRIAERERQKVELETARLVQASILPTISDTVRGVEIAHAYLPATEIGGDFYDVLPLQDGRIAFALGDVAGHGVPSGLVMATLRGALQVHARFEPAVETVFSSLNSLLAASSGDRLLTTLVYGILDPAARCVTFAAAGHVVWRMAPDGTLGSYSPTVYPLGVRDDLNVRIEIADLCRGETLVLTSDGLIEALAESEDEPYGYERLEASLRRHAGASAHDLLAGMLNDVDEHIGERPLDDDCTALVLRLP